MVNFRLPPAGQISAAVDTHAFLAEPDVASRFSSEERFKMVLTDEPAAACLDDPSWQVRSRS
jgi:hypothetical protein